MIRFPLSISFSAAIALSFCYSSLIQLPIGKSLTRSSFYSCSSRSPCPSTLSVDLLSILGPKNDVDTREARQILSCLKFLSPFSPLVGGYNRLSGEDFEVEEDIRLARTVEKVVSSPIGGRIRFRYENCKTEEDRNIRWPPEPVLELARIAVDSGGDPAIIQAALDPTMLKIPDVEGLEEDKCQLTRTPYGRRFINEEVNAYFAFLFELIADRSPAIGLNISLSRYDLFHGHIFLATDTGRLGILFHAREYPAYEKNVFPINMGYCQKGSSLAYDESMNLRNILWLAPLPCNRTKSWLAPGVLVALDARPGGIIYDCLVPEYVNYVRTIYEDDFGDNVADVNYFNIVDAPSSQRIFIC